MCLKKYEKKGNPNMTAEEQRILDKINAYAEKALADIDPRKPEFPSN